MEIKEGDMVVIRDSSYSQTPKDGCLSDSLWRCDYPEDRKGTFKVLKVGCVIPSYYKGETNNTIIQSTRSGRIVFIKLGFLEPTQHTINVDGKEIKISHESYLNLKKSLSD